MGASCRRLIGGDRELASRRTYQWAHDLGGIVQGALAAGLRIEALKEYPFQFYERYATMIRDEQGRYRMPADQVQPPLLFSLLARRPVGPGSEN